MSPVYEYRCEHCGEELEAIRDYEHRDGVTCPECGELATRLVSSFITSSTLNHKFFKEGEGFSSVHYDPEEYEYRIKTNAAKYDPI